MLLRGRDSNPAPSTSKALQPGKPPAPAPCQVHKATLQQVQVSLRAVSVACQGVGYYKQEVAACEDVSYVADQNGLTEFRF